MERSSWNNDTQATIRPLLYYRGRTPLIVIIVVVAAGMLWLLMLVVMVMVVAMMRTLECC